MTKCCSGNTRLILSRRQYNSKDKKLSRDLIYKKKLKNYLMIILRSFLNQAPKTKKHHHWHANLYRAGGS